MNPANAALNVAACRGSIAVGYLYTVRCECGDIDGKGVVVGGDSGWYSAAQSSEDAVVQCKDVPVSRGTGTAASGAATSTQMADNYVPKSNEDIELGF